MWVQILKLTKFNTHLTTKSSYKDSERKKKEEISWNKVHNTSMYESTLLLASVDSNNASQNKWEQWRGCNEDDIKRKEWNEFHIKV